MKDFQYQPNLTGLIVIEDEQKQFDDFFYSGHPQFLIPNFSEHKKDIWLSFLSYLEKEYNEGEEVYDQDGGELSEQTIINKETGLTKCKYTAYGIQLKEEDEPRDIEVEIHGFVVLNQFGESYFIATKISEKV
jgi:hypothetical protein